MQFEFGETLIVFNALLGAVLLINVLVLLYVKRLQDERYTHILSLAARNAFLFLMMVLPFLSALQFLNIAWIEPGLSVFAVWIVSLITLYASSYYYYRR
ncbi:MAG: hypothetical protein ACXABY_03115 [Candidatus Thorarchaeota archaeon]|jgi:hypothetical protein